ncbi:periplasmic nitrate reductase, NapE protein [Thalassotalea euphylliae]|uniref:Periplasmic nitrate reductase, NapE protein n=1 Tax=Thalassotalea euphylliae TaxID=1655234 RepID=A0A3E0UBU0_9GAMM|nr:periplasmic nitrate reductase, NapE protein [Thalassotalea euphylliae]REL30588.1 periplasmic nitrate reductase, NapE protein [Thalassotalea euphylliae]REL34481.1 periplasmic nitrate reductase, NapE protein [Thalassotalea euphylliae]
MNIDTNSQEQALEKKYERNLFIFIAVFLGPILAVMIVGGYGFIVWISQILTGPPTS